MKKIVLSLMVMVLLVVCVPSMKGYASTSEDENGVQQVVSEYMQLRWANMQEEPAIEDWNDIVVAGIVSDEARYADALVENELEILDAEYNILMVEGIEFIYVTVLETIEFANNIDV